MRDFAICSQEGKPHAPISLEDFVFGSRDGLTPYATICLEDFVFGSPEGTPQASSLVWQNPSSLIGFLKSLMPDGHVGSFANPSCPTGDFVYCHIWSYLAISGHIWQYLAISCNIWQYLAISCSICQYLAISGYIWQYLAISRHIWQYLRISGHMQYLTISGNIWPYLAIPPKQLSSM